MMRHGPSQPFVDVKDRAARQLGQVSSAPAAIEYRKTWRIVDADGAQTNLVLHTPASGKKIVVTQALVTVDNACTSDVAVLVGCAASTLATPTKTTPTDKLAIAHPGIAKGSGVAVGDGFGRVLTSAVNDKLLLTCEDPVGGALDVTVSWFEE